MKRRDFIKALALGIIGGGVASDAMAQIAGISTDSPSGVSDDQINDYLIKMKNFNRPHKDDVYINGSDYRTFIKVVKKLRRLQKLVGHGNFNLLSFDDGLITAERYPSIGKFSKTEVNFMEKIFYDDASSYGFFGYKPMEKLTTMIKRKDVIRIRETGEFLFRGTPYETFIKIRREMGNQLIITSGIRSAMKQLLLFFNRVYISNGNLSLASRSLAPPGYSYHGIGDFDVGQAGFGAANFTQHFTSTGVFKKLNELGYLSLRYPYENMLGVRFEPWHIKTVA